jgi:ferredoxin
VSIPVKVFVDVDRCQGHGRCNALCPEVFDLDEEGFVVLLTPVVGDAEAAEVREAERNCPERAISTG